MEYYEKTMMNWKKWMLQKKKYVEHNSTKVIVINTQYELKQGKQKSMEEREKKKRSTITSSFLEEKETIVMGDEAKKRNVADLPRWVTNFLTQGNITGLTTIPTRLISHAITSY